MKLGQKKWNEVKAKKTEIWIPKTDIEAYSVFSMKGVQKIMKELIKMFGIRLIYKANVGRIWNLKIKI